MIKMSLVSVYQHKGTSERIYFPVRELSPDEISLLRFKYRVHHALKKVTFKTFFTLTYRDSELPAESSHLREFWNRFRQRERANKFSYVWRFEWHGRPHVHGMTTLDWIDNDELNTLWRRGFTNVRGVNNQQHAAFYAAKYITKIHKQDAKVRRYGFSRDLVMPVRKSDWQLKKKWLHCDDVDDYVHAHNQKLPLLKHYFQELLD